MLEGSLVRLEPLTWQHLPALTSVAVNNPELWRWTSNRVRSEDDLRRYMQTAFDWQAEGTCMPWAIVQKQTGQPIGCTRMADISQEHRSLEIGWTWVDPAHQRTGINVETKYLLLTHAFEAMGALRVALKTHHQNLKSQAAIRALGAVEEGTFRNHMIHHDGSARHSVWFSILPSEWPDVKARLEARMQRNAS